MVEKIIRGGEESDFLQFIAFDGRDGDQLRTALERSSFGASFNFDNVSKPFGLRHVITAQKKSVTLPVKESSVSNKNGSKDVDIKTITQEN